MLYDSRMSDPLLGGNAVATGSIRPTSSSAAAPMRVRCLPDGNFQQGLEAGWEGRLLRADVSGGEFAFGMPLEIECGSMTYLGELQERSGSIHVIRVEHSVDRAKLDFLEDGRG